MTPTDRDIDGAVLRALREGPALRLAVLFGSTASGSRRPDSDVDLAIWPEDAALPLRDEMRLSARLEEELGVRVDLVRLDTAPMLVQWEVARTGRPLVGRPDDAWPRFVARAAARHADEAPALRRAAEIFRRRVARGDGR